ncbi:MAG TPA: SWIM zinc finger family protein [Tepidisphaeraceae bacterium]
MSWWGFKPHVSVAQRKAKAARHAQKLAKQGHVCCPVAIDGRKIAKTFWGKAWCDHLESYSDFANRLPRGRTYVCNGSVIDLQITPGTITALVSGSEIYTIKVDIKPLAEKTWADIKGKCAGQIASLVELLQGKLSTGVMEIITRRDGGMFPAPKEITLDCSCPDWADMCKHVAAVLYGIGARFDQQPELLFTLRGVDHMELIEQAGQAPLTNAADKGRRTTVAERDLADVFGIELSEPAAPPADESEVKPAAPAKKRSGDSTKTNPEKPVVRLRDNPAAKKKGIRKAGADRKSKTVRKKRSS